TPSAGVDTHPRPATHASSVHGSPSPQIDAPATSQSVTVVGGGAVVVVVTGTTRIGSLRATTVGSPMLGSELRSRTSYEPCARSAGRISGWAPAASPAVGHQADRSPNPSPKAPSGCSWS